MKIIGIVIIVFSVVGLFLLLLPIGQWRKFRKAGDKVSLMRLLRAKISKVPIQQMADICSALAAINVKAGFEQLFAIRAMGGDIEHIKKIIIQAHEKGQRLTFIEACRKDAAGRVPTNIRRKK